MVNYSLLQHIPKGKPTLQTEFKDMPGIPDPRNPYLSDADRRIHEEWNQRDANYNKAQDIAISGRNQALKLAVYPALQPKYQKHHEKALSLWDLVGKGDVRENCGSVRFAVSCPSNSHQTTLDSGVYSHDNFMMLHSCHRAECPVDYMSWAYREGKKVEERLKKGSFAYLEAGVKLGHQKHIVLSPLQKKAIALMESGKQSDYNILRRSGYEMAALLGIKGGAVIFHPYRLKGDIAQLLKVEGYGTGYNSKGSLWAGVHVNVLGLPSWKDYVNISPHFHIIGVGYFMKADDFYKASGGWTYKNKGVRSVEASQDKSNFGSDLSEVGRTVVYALSHSGLPNSFNVQSLTWFGVFSYNKVVLDSESKVKQAVHCSKCDSELHHYDLTYDLDGLGNEIIVPDFDYDNGVLYVIHKLRFYKLSKSALAWCNRQLQS